MSNNLAIRSAHRSYEQIQPPQPILGAYSWVQPKMVTQSEEDRKKRGHFQAGTNVEAGSEASSLSMSLRVGKSPNAETTPLWEEK